MKLTNPDSHYLFLKSAFSEVGSFMSLNEIRDWLINQNKSVFVNINKIDFKQLSLWKFGHDRLSHDSGKFFSIDGISINTNWGNVKSWDQPIINQPEVGYLGIIAKEFDGILHFLMQAKIEPGNVNYVQLSPTLQATRSNYSQVHKGKKPLYLEYFLNAKPSQILLDQLQSEQGARFLRKRNRNIIIKIEEEISVSENFIWVTLGQLKLLMQSDNLINMDTRTVISGIPYGDFDYETLNLFSFLPGKDSINSIGKAFLKSALSKNNYYCSIENVITSLTHLKSVYDLEVKQTPLLELKDWVISENEIQHIEKKYFKVIAVNVEIGNREVVNWSQPMIEPAQEGLCAFVCKEINGLIHFIVQAKLECGNFDIIEFAPTVQCLTGNYRKTDEGALPFLEFVINAKDDQIIFDVMQSEEGGRFFREQNRNMIVKADDNFSNDLPENYMWMTLNQLQIFLKFNNYLNIQARSLIAGISFI